MSDDILQLPEHSASSGATHQPEGKAMWTQLFGLSVQFRPRALQVRTNPKAKLLYPITCKTRYTYIGIRDIALTREMGRELVLHKHIKSGDHLLATRKSNPNNA
jgi:hypothetical protein